MTPQFMMSEIETVLEGKGFCQYGTKICSDTFDNVRNELIMMLEYYMAGDDIYDYNVVCDLTNNNATTLSDHKILVSCWYCVDFTDGTGVNVDVVLHVSQKDPNPYADFDRAMRGVSG